MIEVLKAVRPALLITTAAFVLTTFPAWADQAPANSDNQTEEQEMLAKARKERDDRRRAVRTLEGTVDATSRTSAGATVDIGATPAKEKQAEAGRREDELRRLSEKLRRASQMRVARPAKPVDGPWVTEVRTGPEIVERAPYDAANRSALGKPTRPTVDDDGRVTVLMVMKPGNRGIRRFERTADPILCTNDGCYISNGARVAAQFISLRRSFGFANTFGPRAGACRHQTACVFRGVDISGSNGYLQPVDLKVLVHDRRGMTAVDADRSCQITDGRLSCERTIIGDNYALWVVPEHIADKAGAELLSRAVEGNLDALSRRAELQ